MLPTSRNKSHKEHGDLSIEVTEHTFKELTWSFPVSHRLDEIDLDAIASCLDNKEITQVTIILWPSF